MKRRSLSLFVVFVLVGFVLVVGRESESQENDGAIVNSGYGAAAERPLPSTGNVPSFQVSEPVVPILSPAVRDLPVETIPPLLNREINPVRSPYWLSGGVDLVDGGPDALAPHSLHMGEDTPPLELDFAGLTSSQSGGAQVPDTNGDVGPNHYIQMVNVAFVIFDKSGNIVSGPFSLNQLWASLGAPCGTQNAGDPVVLYDPLADRWLMSQFAFGAEMCLAVSQTADPTGAYYLYHFSMPTFPDYFKLGVWPDGYYLSANEYQLGDFSAVAFDRVSMLQGDAATYQRFGGGENMYLPSDIDGPTPPPDGAPNYFYTFLDDSFHGGDDRLEVWGFNVDWDTPSNSTFQLEATIDLTDYNYTVCGFFVLSCIPQPSPGVLLSPVSEFPMWRFPYRNFGSHETLLGNFTIDVNGANQAGIRWFELRKTGGGSWTLHQEGTFAPDNLNRWMGSMAMDRDGNIAMGFSIASSSKKPAIHYTVRGEDDPLGTFRTEAVMLEGDGVQTGTNRWGDYAAMGIDPVDDCTFWFTTEYYPSNASTNWGTHIGSFRMPGCGVGLTDMGVTQTAVSKAPLTHPVTYTIGIENNGLVTATGVTLVDTLPAGSLFAGAEPAAANCTHDGGEVTCAVGTLLSQTGLTVTVMVTPTESGTLTNSVTISADNGDNDMSNNTAVWTTTVQPVADLSVAVVSEVASVFVGSLFSPTVVITNHGPSEATGVVLTVTLPASVLADVDTSVDVDASANAEALVSTSMCNTVGMNLVCEVGTIAPQMAAMVEIGLQAPDGVGMLQLPVHIRSGALDFTVENNTLVLETAVVWYQQWLPVIQR